MSMLGKIVVAGISALPCIIGLCAVGQFAVAVSHRVVTGRWP